MSYGPVAKFFLIVLRSVLMTFAFVIGVVLLLLGWAYLNPASFPRNEGSMIAMGMLAAAGIALIWKVYGMKNEVKAKLHFPSPDRSREGKGGIASRSA